MEKKDYQNIHNWEFYASSIQEEYRQCIDEGLDIQIYQELFNSIDKLPKGEIKEKLGDVVFDIVSNAKKREDYQYDEPSTFEEIIKLTKPYKSFATEVNDLEDKISGAWMGRIIGCMLGKSIEGIRLNELTRLLKETDNYPLSRYILRSDLNKIDLNTYKYDLANRLYIDELDGMPCDDDTNYMVLAQKIIEEYGRNFTANDVASSWLKYQPKDAYCTAERVAFINFVKGYSAPYSALYKNPYREWIGAQIRVDYYGYINIGDPLSAALMAFKDASISHVKNGIYGAMFIASMIATAGVTNNLLDIIYSGLAHIPCTSRLYNDINLMIDAYQSKKTKEECFNLIHKKYDEKTEYGWCHTNPNAMIVVASLLYGDSDYAKSICMAVETGFDTDCNGATVGSILGMANGIKSIPNEWQKPINNKLYTAIFGVESIEISECVKKTLKHLNKE